jgi:hypothetical protein
VTQGFWPVEGLPTTVDKLTLPAGFITLLYFALMKVVFIYNVVCWCCLKVRALTHSALREEISRITTGLEGSPYTGPSLKTRTSN